MDRGTTVQLLLFSISGSQIPSKRQLAILSNRLPQKDCLAILLFRVPHLWLHMHSIGAHHVASSGNQVTSTYLLRNRDTLVPETPSKRWVELVS